VVQCLHCACPALTTSLSTEEDIPVTVALGFTSLEAKNSFMLKWQIVWQELLAEQQSRENVSKARAPRRAQRAITRQHGNMIKG